MTRGARGNRRISMRCTYPVMEARGAMRPFGYVRNVQPCGHEPHPRVLLYIRNPCYAICMYESEDKVTRTWGMARDTWRFNPYVRDQLFTLSRSGRVVHPQHVFRRIVLKLN
jgi:hypothetical protein